MILMIDNYDSFTYNLVQYLGELGAEVETVRNDAVTVDDVLNMDPEGIVLSPGPCTPNEAGICLDLVRRWARHADARCLPWAPVHRPGFWRQSRARERIMHGKTSMIYHRSQGVFNDCPSLSRRPAIIRWCWSRIPFLNVCP